MKVSDAIRESAARLAEVSDTARLDAELLMAHALGCSRSDLLLKHMAVEVPEGFAPLLARRMASEPVAYILGVQEFYGREFQVNGDVLIPRADSECVVAAALEVLQDGARVLDLGTGSGALLLTLLAEAEGSEGIGVDNSARALAVAAANAAALGLEGRASFQMRDWRQEGWANGLGSFHLIISNPPYVESTAMLAKSVAEYEPHSALFSGEEGLDDYRILIPQLRALLAPDGAAVLEIGAEQGESVAEIARENGFTTALRRDLAHRARALILT